MPAGAESLGRAAWAGLSRMWPGALLVDGEIRRPWRPSQHTVRIDAWERVSRRRRDAIEARTLPLPGVDGQIEVVWNDGEGSG